MIPLKTASPHPVTHIAFAPDGGTVAVAQPHHGVTLLDRATGHTRGVCALPKSSSFKGIVFCGEGKFLAVGSPRGLAVFDASTGASVCSRRRGYPNLLLADRGPFLTGASGGQVRFVWAPDVGFATKELYSRPAPAWATALALSADGRLALLATPGRWELLDIDRGRVVSGAATAADAGPAVARFCPLGRRFALTDRYTLGVYDLGADLENDHADEALVAHRAHTEPVAPMPHAVLEPTFTLAPAKASDAGAWQPPFALLPDGRGLLVRRPRNRVQLWDAPTGTLVNEWSWQLEWVNCLAVSGDGTTAVAGGRFGRVLLWDLD